MEHPSVRKPAVADLFYPGDPERLRAMIRPWLEASGEPADCRVIIVPHAGYPYSGEVAARAFSKARLPKNLILLGPNHTGAGAPVALYPGGSWETPLGKVPTNEKLIEAIAKCTPLVERDEAAHLREHSLEVQLPLIQVAAPQSSIVPLCIGRCTLDESHELARALLRALTEDGDPWLLVVSSDLSHYEPAEVARSKDEALLERILALDPEGTLEVAQQRSVSACGLLPILLALQLCRELGTGGSELLMYRHSGHVTGDLMQVVGYASLLLGTDGADSLS